MIAVLHAYLPAILAICTPVVLATVSAVIAKYNPAAGPPPLWLVPLIAARNLLAFRAPEGTKGIGGTQWSVPGHWPKRKPNGLAIPARRTMTGGPGALVPLLFFAFGASACTPAQVQGWRTAGIDAATCAGTGVLDAAGDALSELLAQAAGGTGALDYQQLGLDLATKYGTAAALCAVGKAWAVLGPTVTVPGHLGAVTRAALLVGWLVQHPKEWSTGRPKSAHVYREKHQGPFPLTGGAELTGSGPVFWVDSETASYQELCSIDAYGKITGPNPEACGFTMPGTAVAR